MLKKKDVNTLQAKITTPEYDVSAKQCPSPPKIPLPFFLQ
jgi:hypothetical protein